jgi:hypothetical protein
MNPLRILGAAWALPWTLLGLLLALVTRSRLDRRTGTTLIVSMSVLTEDALRALGRLFGATAFVGWTCGDVVFLRSDLLQDERLIRHELRHVQQMHWFGPLFPLVYCAASLVAVARGGHIYRDNRFEIDARRAAERT